MKTNSNFLPIAGAAWLIAPIIYLVTQAVASTRFSPAYDYQRNLISELGVTKCGPAPHGPPICSPLHGVMNAGFIAEGALFILATALVFGLLQRRRRTGFAVLGLAHGIGLMLVGLFHVGAADRASGAILYHLTGAAMAILCGNIAIAISPLAADLGGPAPLRWFGKVAGVVGVLAVVVLGVTSTRRETFLLGYGLWERLSVYTILAWDLVTGVWLLGRSLAASRRTDVALLGGSA
jgi:hypothetical membrane protein